MGFLSLRSSFFKKKDKTKKSTSAKISKDLTTAYFEPASPSETLSASACERWALTKDDPIPETAPEALKVVREWVRHKDEHNLDKMRELTADKCFFTFVDSETEMPAREFFGSVGETYASFPDLHFFWRVMEVKDMQAGVTTVVVKDYHGIGKHTGTPYGFGPFPPIDPTGTVVKDENIEFTFTVKEGKITDATIDAFGGLVGPPGFYTKIGGVLF